MARPPERAAARTSAQVSSGKARGLIERLQSATGYVGMAGGARARSSGPTEGGQLAGGDVWIGPTFGLELTVSAVRLWAAALEPWRLDLFVHCRSAVLSACGWPRP